MNYVGDRPDRDYTLEVNGKEATPSLSMRLPAGEWTVVGLAIEDVPELQDPEAFRNASIDGFIGITAPESSADHPPFYYVRFTQ